VKVQFNDILYAEALKDFSRLYLQEKTMLVSAHLKMMEDMLPLPASCGFTGPISLR
jgi:two-component system, LytTR family, response regulator